ncbi:MAG TPA: hypothetical protein PLV68_18000, partial [Ilumatobacteraceae bacterium]|nr:hypothetical protein [Ilumatobacteraceae bacterium]
TDGPTSSTTDSDRTTAPPTSDGSVPADASILEWEPFGRGLETSSLKVPVDYDDSSKGTFDLFLMRHPARDLSKRIGTLLVNPGGPGFGGSILAQLAPQVYSEDLLDHFDIIGWDPRGTGLSEPFIDCI